MILEVAGIPFHHVCEITPELENGSLFEYMPQSRYKNVKNYSLNKYGNGPFCKFKISKGYKYKSGVYILCLDKKLVYVGECVDLESRYNTGYGHISPINCYKVGRSTNCRINSLILESAKNGTRVDLLFYETNDREILEKTLIMKLRPSWNLEHIR